MPGIMNDEVVQTPLQIVQRLYSEAGCPLGSDTDFGVAAHIAAALSDPAALARVRGDSTASTGLELVGV